MSAVVMGTPVVLHDSCLNAISKTCIYKQLLCQPASASKHVPPAVVLESFGKGDAPGSAAMPACIVLERWDFSLSDWNNKLQRQPDDVELQSALYMVRASCLDWCCLWPCELAVGQKSCMWCGVFCCDDL